MVELVVVMYVVQVLVVQIHLGTVTNFLCWQLMLPTFLKKNMNMKNQIKYICLLMIIINFSCKDKVINNDLVIIFKKPNISDTVYYNKKIFTVLNNRIFYRKNKDFIDNNLMITNKDSVIKIKTDEPIYFYHIYYKNDFYLNSYIFNPGDTIEFTYNEGVPIVSSKDKGKKHYNYSAFFDLKNQKNSDETSFFVKENRFRNVKENQLLNEKLKIIKNKKSAYLKSLLKKELISNIEYDLLENNAIEKNEIFKKNELNLSDINNSYFLIEKFNKTVLKDKNFRKAFFQIDTIKNQKYKDFLKYYCLEEIAKLDNKKDFLYCFEKYNHNKEHYNLFKNNYPHFFIKDKDGLNGLDEFGKEIRIIDEFKKGKVYYVDIWASWCAPCRAEFKNYPEIKKRFNNKNIEFVFLSLDKKFNDWKSSLIKEKSIMDKTYFVINGFDNNYIKSLKINMIPRYLIFDKNGDLVNTDAPHPSEKEKLYRELDKYLSE
jgi:thiol-disulfide isomerase/thioredoxin